MSFSDRTFSATDGFAVTASDATVFSPPAVGLYVGATGNVTVTTAAGSTVTFPSVPAGAILPVQCRQVRATGTTASSIVALTHPPR